MFLSLRQVMITNNTYNVSITGEVSPQNKEVILNDQLNTNAGSNSATGNDDASHEGVNIKTTAENPAVGWSMSSRMTAELTTIAALKQYVRHYSPAPGVIFHSDRGVQYASDNFRTLLKKYQFIQSMSGKGNCYDNAVAESFFKTLKTELVYHERYWTRAQARASIFEYIEVFYNRVRKHSYLGYLSPEQFELKSKNDAA